MGKRKERRVAAKMAAGRRVKLDLLAEPSGDLVATSAHDGRDTDKDLRAVVPTSSSSSSAFGRFQEETVTFSVREKHENPLLLLGQYSDDELEVETSKRPKLDAGGSSPDAQDDEEPAENLQCTEKDINGNGNVDEEQSDQVHAIESLARTEGKENGYTEAATDHPETDPATQVTAHELSGIESTGELHAGWKLVMHEESNQYYYWNTATGETSWEIPAALVGHTLADVEGGISRPEAHLSIEPATCAYLSAADGMRNSHLISKDAVEHSSVLETQTENVEIARVDYDANQALANYSDSAAGISFADPSALSQFGSSMQTNAVSTEQLTVPKAEVHISNDDDKDAHLGKSNGCYGTEDSHSFRLVKCCESLLLRLEALDRSGSCLENQECISKEIDIRLSDCNALSSYGSSLLPFWWHTEARLKQLECAVSEGEASLVSASHGDNLEATQNCSLRDLPKSMDSGSHLMENETGIASTVKHSCRSPSPDVSRFSPSPDVSRFRMEADSQIRESEHAKFEFSSASHLMNEHEHVRVQETNLNNAPPPLLLEGEHALEDVDMDVEMEVDEDPLPGQTTATDCISRPKLSVQSNQSLPEFPPPPSDEPSVPPPPDEEWIPPPPPDSEPVPPPPPEEPPLPLVPALCPDLIPCAPYPDQYSIEYTTTAQEYYSSAAEVTGNNYYVQADGSHITQSQLQPYYEPVVTSAFDLSPAEPVVYYDVASVVVPSGLVANNMGSSSYYIESTPFSYHGSASVLDHAGFSMEPASNISLLPTVNTVLESPAHVPECQESTMQVAFVPSSGQSVGNALGNSSIVDALPVASSKNQTKVVRKKKHTVAVAPSLRSNKKVSSLVDKWKAAKEELHSEDEDEPEDAYEILEKKRHKEIEKWRARQIASGEAQDNANFLPLGGDWRERVKRKKAEEKTESVQTPTEVSEGENDKQPDLAELSKGLPSGWQAYWDESSKKAYYGNSITAETTWIRPTR